jgi:hypothetical protein
MKNFADYLAESEYASHNPVAGDNLCIELPDETAVDTWIVEADDHSLLLASTPEILEALSQCCTFGETLTEAEYQGRKVQLGKPKRGGSKKFYVYVKNDKGNVVKVSFGDPNMKIKKSNPARRRNFRARHNCDNPGPRHKARYWSCKAW